MSKLSTRKRRARFETGVTVFDRRTRPVLVELTNEFMILRLKGTRTKYALTYSAAFMYAMQKASLAEATARRLARKNKGGQK
jgi:hypothetical protein